MRWTEELSKYNFHISYRSGKEGTQSDILSRREQDMFKNEDSRYTHREMLLLKSELFDKRTLVVSMSMKTSLDLDRAERSTLISIAALDTSSTDEMLIEDL
jgi:hypothetical protein